MTNEKIPENVRAFLDVAAKAYGEYKEECFGQYIWGECCDIKSPIEQMFLIALHLVAEVNVVNVDVMDEFDNREHRLIVVPQWRAGTYKVDFALRLHPVDKIVCVELDGHDFHDRDERQRRYEKTRDRFLTSKGYQVLHFTGSEVVKDPCAVALEAFVLAADAQKYAIHPLEDQ